jgi:hypothetical protein
MFMRRGSCGNGGLALDCTNHLTTISQFSLFQRSLSTPRTRSMTGRSWSEDFTLYAEEPKPRPRNSTTRSWSFCDGYSYHLPLNTTFGDHNTVYEEHDDVTLAPNMDYPQATTMTEKCGYRTGKCFNVRSLKRNGMFHKLCHAHREKANLNQKRLDHKKRLRRVSPYDAPRCDDAKHDDSSTNKEQLEIMNLNKTPNAFLAHIDETPLDLTLEELVFFCDVMMTETLKKTDNRKVIQSRGTVGRIQILARILICF